MDRKNCKAGHSKPGKQAGNLLEVVLPMVVVDMKWYFYCHQSCPEAHLQ
jgi:hypothetical protein